VSAPQDQTGMARPRDQVNHERAMGEVSDVLLNLEHTLNRTRKALKVVAKTGTEINAELALTVAVKDLERLRKRLLQDTYFAGDALRLI
jgi:DNA repair photolyase